MLVWQPAKLQPDGLRLMHLGDVAEVVDVNPLALNAKHRSGYDVRRAAGPSAGADLVEACIEMDPLALTGNLKTECLNRLRISPDTGNPRRCTADEALLINNDSGVVGCLVRAR